MQKRKLALIVATLFITLFASSAIAQTETGQITGKVTDPNGQVVPGATIAVKSVGTGRELNTSSNSDGSYSVSALQPGAYDLKVQGGNFKPATKRVEVTVGSSLTVDLQLTLTEVSGTVDVVAGQGVEVNTQTQELSNVVSGKQIRELPTLTRNPYDLVGLSGNVSNDEPAEPVPGVGVSSRGAGFNINGQRASSTNLLLDGVDNTNYYVAAVGQKVPLDAVGEFRVITSNFSAEYGRASGGIINVSTRAGTNSFHGSGYEFNRISRFASNGFSNNANGTPRGVFTRNQFGYTIGGPVFKNKLFFFNSTEFTRIRSATDLLGVVPTADLLAASSPATQAYFSNFQLKGRPTGTVFTAGGLAAGFGSNPTGPFGSLPANLPAFQVVAFSEPVDAGGGPPQNTYSTVSRVDYNLSNKTLIYGRWARESIVSPNGTSANSPYQGFDTPAEQLNNNFLVAINHTFSPKLVAETKLAFNRLNSNAPYGAQPIGPGLFLFNGPTGTIGGQPVTLPGYWPYNAASSPAGSGGPQNLGQIYEDVTLTRGRNQFKFGGVAYYIQDNHYFGAYQNAVETLAVGGNYAQALDNLVSGSLFQFLAAINPQNKFPGQSVTLPVSPPDFSRSNRYKEWAAYFNDSLHYTPRLVLNLGLRYEYYGVQHNKDPNLDSNFYFGQGSTLQQQIANGAVQIASNSPVGGLWKPSKKNFAPRFGFAWDVLGDGKTSFRGGYGMSYERNFGNVTFNLIQNPPNYAVIALQNGTDIVPPATLPITLSNFGPLAGNTPPTKILPKTSLRHVRQDIVNAYAHTFSLALEHQLGTGNLLSVEYSGAMGRKLYSIDAYNPPGAGAVYLGLANTHARLNQQYTGINGRGNDGYSNYNALIVGFDGDNFRKLGMQFTARYTYAVTRDNISSTFSEGATDGFLGLTNPYIPSLDYGYANFDVRHRFVGSSILDVPFFKNSRGLTRAVLGGWQVTTIFVARTGTPFSIFDATGSLGQVPRLVANGPITVNVVNDSTQADVFHYINLAGQPTHAISNPLCGGCSDFGPYPANMTARNQFRAPGYWNIDAGLYKNIRLTERFNLQLRGEMFNAFNHSNLYLSPGTLDVGNGSVDAAKGVTVNGNLERRNVQFAAKLIF